MMEKDYEVVKTVTQSRDEKSEISMMIIACLPREIF